MSCYWLCTFCQLCLLKKKHKVRFSGDTECRQYLNLNGGKIWIILTAELMTMKLQHTIAQSFFVHLFFSQVNIIDNNNMDPLNGLYPGERLATATGSLRWWHADFGHRQVKGSITLRKCTLPISYNGFIVSHDILFSGHWVGCLDDKPITYTLMLPPCKLWTLSHSKVRSTNAKARVILLEFKSEKTGLPLTGCVQKVQITIPFTSEDGKQEKEFIQQFILAASPPSDS
jgi:hypothetical protein